MERGKRLYTIGHSNRSIENLIETLKHFGVLRVVDVRQSPYSKRCGISVSIKKYHLGQVPTVLFETIESIIRGCWH